MDLIQEHYLDLPDHAERRAVTRFQAQILDGLFRGDYSESLALRSELVAYCRRKGITEDVVAQAEQAVFHELNFFIEARFRNSQRQRLTLETILREAFSVLSRKSEPSRTPVRHTPALQARQHFAYAAA